MQIAKWMKAHPRAIKPLDSIDHARALMEEHRVNQLPVVHDGRLVGIVTCLVGILTRSDLLDALVALGTLVESQSPPAGR